MITSLNTLLETLGVETPSRFGRAIYKWVDCGPWVEFLVNSDNYEGVYYEDTDVDEKVTNDNCVGINVGSIVEGSDAEIGPVGLFFPFTPERLWDTLDGINEEACYEWDIANLEEDDEVFN